MAQSFATDQGTLIIPGAYSSITVQTSNAGLATNGVLMLVGEAAQGPSYVDEVDLGQNFFGPDQLALVVAKYGSGQIVDAFRAGIAPANDPNIQGAPTGFIIAKTNDSELAFATILHFNSSSYGTLAALSEGSLGNLIYFDIVANVAEVVPTTGPFTFLPPIAAFDYSIRVSGGAAQTGSGTVAPATLPPAFVSNLSAVTGIAVSGGVNRNVLTSGQNGDMMAIVAVGNSVTFTISGGTFQALAQIGDTLYINATSELATASGNSTLEGSYVVTALGTSTVIVATKLQDATGTPGTNTSPVVGTTPVTMTSTAATDLEIFSPITVAYTPGNPVDGIGKDLEINELSSSADRLSNCLYSLNTTKVTFVSKSGAAKLLTSASEYVAEVDDNRQVDNISEQLIAGGEIALKVGYTGTTATVQYNGTNIIGVVTGGSGAGFSIVASQFPTIADVVAYIGSLPGWSASVGNGILGQLLSSSLDQGTFNACTNFGNQTARIKIDAFRFLTRAIGSSVLLQLGVPPARAASGLPAPQTITFLSGGARGATSQANVTGAIDALQNVQGNFLVPLFSQDASLDIAAGLTDPSSTYTIAGINAYAKTHCILMSQLKRKRNRQAFLSIRDTFVNDQNAASNIASFRSSMAFQDIKNTDSTGTIVQFQPWMGATVAAGIQAAGFYRGIVQKYANISGILSSAGDFNDQDDDQVEQALLAGLLPLRRDPTGGFYFVSDQTTYGKDNNFVFNSIQATYVADVIAITTAQRMQRAFVGQSVADVSATLALSFIENIMADFLRLKLIAPSDDGAPKGYKNVVVRLSGTALIISLEVKLAGLIYFVPISFTVSQVQQTATG
jgi:hypothetical protein